MATDKTHPLVSRIRASQLFTEGELVMVGVSGGADSVALLSLLRHLGLPLHALHCNFELRGEESHRDEDFVRHLCAKWNVPLSVKHFFTASYAQAHDLSIEMAARQLRYEWFDTQVKEFGAQAVAVAHHLDDQAETVLLNLVRGTGLLGLCGMKERQGIVVRPLLNVRKSEILDYLTSEGQDYVTDSTNLEREALRNRLRLDIIPLLRNLNPKVDEALCHTAKIIGESLPIYRLGLDKIFRQNDVTPDRMPLSLLRSHPSAATLLHEWLAPYSFNASQEEQILSTLHAVPGRRWESPSTILLLDRGNLLLAPRKAPAAPPPRLSQTIVSAVAKSGLGTAYFDADLITKPLTLRLVRQGDAFYPFGLGKRRLLSDFMTDQKLNLFQKQSQYVLCHGEDIIWVVGLRSDHRYRVTSNTTRILKISVTTTE